MLLKKNTCILNFIRYSYHTICCIVGKLLQFPALVVFFTAFNIAESGYKRNLLIFSISAQWYSELFRNFRKFPVLVWTIFAISPLLLMIFLSIWVILPRIHAIIQCVRPVVAVNPAVSCKRNRSSLMNFPNILGFPKRRCLSDCKY